MQLHPCTRCQRHVDTHAGRCPFCGTAQLASRSRSLLQQGARLSRAAVFSGAAACASYTPPPTPPPPPDQQVAFEEPPPPSPNKGTLYGTVRQGRYPLANTTVYVDHNNGQHNASTTTDANGRYTFADLEPGVYDVSMASPGNVRHGPGPERLQLEAGTRRRHDLTAPAPETDHGPCCKPYGAPPARRRVV